MTEKRTFKLDKIVRDKIVADHLGNDAQVKYRKLSPTEKRQALVKKMGEELSEFLTAGSPAAELADAQEILDQLRVDAGITPEELSAEQAKKRQKNGGFAEGYYIEQETWPASSHWAEYYAKEPERFKEIK